MSLEVKRLTTSQLLILMIHDEALTDALNATGQINAQMTHTKATEVIEGACKEIAAEIDRRIPIPRDPIPAIELAGVSE